MFSGKSTPFANRFRSTKSSNHHSFFAMCGQLHQSTDFQRLVLQQQAELAEGFE